MNKIGLLLIPLFIWALDLTFTKAFNHFKKGVKLLKTDPQSAQKEFKKTYNLIKDKKNSSQVYYMLGRMYCNGWGVEQNYALSEKYFKKALKLGNKRVNCCLARLYIKIGKKDLAKKYLNIAISHPQLKIYCKDINIKNLKIKGE